MKKNEGITLIALIITIIILIILTAVTINNVIGTDLIGFATKAVENYTDAARDEAGKVDKLAGTLENQGVGEDSKVRAGQIVEKTEKDNYTDANGRHATIPEGFKVSTKASEQYIKDGLVIQDEQGNEFVWVPCYYETEPENTPEDLQEYKNMENDTWKQWDYTGYTNLTDEATENEESYGNKSVKEYGGFYIGRYEAGWDETDTSTFTGDKHGYISSEESEIIKKNIETKKPISKENVFAWNFISQTNAKTVSELMYSDIDSVDSKLIDGTAWDTVTNWIATDGVDVTNSTSYGNYRDNDSDYTGWYAVHVMLRDVRNGKEAYTMWLPAKNFTNGPIKLQGISLREASLWETRENDFTNLDKYKEQIPTNPLPTNIEIPTGSYDKFKLKNIYDLAGNMWEFTTETGTIENFDSSLPVVRGGMFRGYGTSTPLCCHSADPTGGTGLDLAVGFRVVLYIQ